MHLTGDAVDIALSSTAVKNWLENNGISIKDETVDRNRCWHLQLIIFYKLFKICFNYFPHFIKIFY
jgi:hypothetical protein